MGGEFNMFEDPNDSREGKLVTIHGPELAEWEKLIFQMDLSDTWHFGNFSQETHSLQFSRLSRVLPRIETTSSPEPEWSTSPNRTNNSKTVIF